MSISYLRSTKSKAVYIHMMFIRQSAITLSRRSVIRPVISRSFVSSLPRRKTQSFSYYTLLTNGEALQENPNLANMSSIVLEEWFHSKVLNIVWFLHEFVEVNITGATQKSNLMKTFSPPVPSPEPYQQISSKRQV